MNLGSPSPIYDGAVASSYDFLNQLMNKVNSLEEKIPHLEQKVATSQIANDLLIESNKKLKLNYHKIKEELQKSRINNESLEQKLQFVTERVAAVELEKQESQNESKLHKQSIEALNKEIQVLKEKLQKYKEKNKQKDIETQQYRLEAAQYKLDIEKKEAEKQALNDKIQADKQKKRDFKQKIKDLNQDLYSTKQSEKSFKEANLRLDQENIGLSIKNRNLMDDSEKKNQIISSLETVLAVKDQQIVCSDADSKEKNQKIEVLENELVDKSKKNELLENGKSSLERQNTDLYIRNWQLETKLSQADEKISNIQRDICNSTAIRQSSVLR